MPKIHTIRPDLADVDAPAELKALRAWCVWRFVSFKGDKKPRKMPHYARAMKDNLRRGVQGSPDDRERLVTFDEARSFAVKYGYEGVGFCPMPEFGIVAVDFDDVVQDGARWADAVSRVAGTYAELSPSGKGLRAFFKGKGFNRKSHAEGKWPYTFETFVSKGFVTFTGRRLDSAPSTIADMTDAVRALIEERWPVKEREERARERSAPSGYTDEQLREMLTKLPIPDGDPRDYWLRVGMALHHETVGEGLYLWDEWSCRGDNYSDYETLQKAWESFDRPRAEGEAEVTIGTLRKMLSDAGVGIPGRVSSADDFDDISGDDPPPGEAPSSGKDDPPTYESMTFSEEELEGFRMSPKCIVQDYLYANLAVLAATGGTGKTSLVLHESICIALGLDVWGNAVVNRGRIVIITAEDDRELMGARLRATMDAMGLSDEERRLALSMIHVWDVSGEMRKLIAFDGNNIVLTNLAAKIIKAYEYEPPAVIVFDPLVSFGCSEQAVNDNEQNLVVAARKIIRGLGCCVRFVHHVSKQNARDKTTDQHSMRGGSALPDGSRMVAILTPGDDDTLVLTRAKLSYSKPQQPIYIRRNGYAFSVAAEPAGVQAQALWDWMRDEELLGTKASPRYVKVQGARVLGITQAQTVELLDTLLSTGKAITVPSGRGSEKWVRTLPTESGV
jgi:hypothetical protein